MTKQELIHHLKGEIIKRHGTVKQFLKVYDFSLSETSLRNAFSINHATMKALKEIAEKLGFEIQEYFSVKELSK